jgi:zinc transport system ATP-binding protein
MSEIAIQIKGLNKSFNNLSILEDVNLEIAANEFVSLIGPNGGGKTVLIKLILGLIKPDDGVIKVLGLPPEKARGQVGYVPQYPRFDFEFPISVFDMVLTGRQIKRPIFARYNREDRRAVKVALEKVEISDLADRQIGKLSGGQVQRALIARAIVADPKVLLADEPTASLDPQMGQCVHELLSELSSEMAVVLVSHDIGVISNYVTSVACLNRTLLYQPAGEPTREMIEAVYHCPVHLMPPHCDCEHPHDGENK